jgi:hypothetical protein
VGEGVKRHRGEGEHRFRQISEVERLTHVRRGWVIVAHLQNGRVIVDTEGGWAKHVGHLHVDELLLYGQKQMTRLRVSSAISP